MYMRKSMRDLTTIEEKKYILERKKLEIEKDKYYKKLLTENKKRSKYSTF